MRRGLWPKQTSLLHKLNVPPVRRQAFHEGDAAGGGSPDALRKIFDKYDTNGDGQLDEHEVHPPPCSLSTAENHRNSVFAVRFFHFQPLLLRLRCLLPPPSVSGCRHGDRWGP